MDNKVVFPEPLGPLSTAHSLGLMSGTASATGLILVHRDAHFDAAPGLELLRLLDK